jgi:hypothetical protein
MIETCHVCRREQDESCGNCATTAVEVGTIQILWDGFVAMTAEVLICRSCDGAWLSLSEKRKVFICRECRGRALTVEIRPAEVVSLRGAA